MNILKRCRNGFTIFNRKDIWQGKSLENYGEFSEREAKLFRALIQPGQCVIDGGASIGCHTLVFSRAVGPQGTVVAFEPERHSFYVLCGNVGINNLSNVFCFNQALSNSGGIVDVPELDYESTNNFGAVPLDRDWSGFPHYPVIRNFIDQVGIPRCDFIKIDVEGMEQQVIEGAIKTIEKYQPILYFDNSKYSLELMNLIDSLGYRHLNHTPPFFNADNFYGNKENHFTKGLNVSLNVLAWPKTKELVFENPVEFDLGMPDEEFQELAAGIPLLQFSNGSKLVEVTSQATSCAVEWRRQRGDFETYLRGRGLDVGAGTDILIVPSGSVRPWDLSDGDAKFLKGIPDDEYDFVYSSHCLEHLNDVEIALENWSRVLKPGGILYFVIPDFKLYEKLRWPSTFNPDHKYSFSLDLKREDVGRSNHCHISTDVLPILSKNKIDVLEIRLEDFNYDYSLPDHVDQTASRNALAQICIIGRKH